MHIISGLYKNRKIASPKGLKTRPTSARLRETLFNICQGEVENASFLDLFAGSGAMGLEALSRQAKFATFVDNSKESVRCIQTNIQTLGLEKSTQVMYGDVYELLKQLAKRDKSFDIIYADPPYETFIDKEQKTLSYSTQVIVLVDSLIETGCSILLPGGSLFVEDADKAIPKEQREEHQFPYKNLILRSSRAMGRSALQHWVRST